MVRQTKRTCAPAPRVEDVPAPSAPRDPSVPPPAMFGPATWCPPYAPQAGAPSAQWLAALQHHGMAGSSAQAAWWAPAGIGAFAKPAPTTNTPSDSDVQAWGVDSDPPGGFVNFLKKSTSKAAQVLSNGSSSQPINIGDDCNGGDEARTEKRLLWTKDEDLRLVSAWLNNSNDPIQANYKKNDAFWKDVTAVFNSTTPRNRRRIAKQVKDHFGDAANAQTTANEGRKEMLETQLRVSSEKLEARKLALLAAKEQKESTMLETYRSLMMQDTSLMSNDVRSEHVLALRCLREKIFGKAE